VTPPADGVRAIVAMACGAVAERGFAGPGDIIAIAAGIPFRVAGSTNLLRIVPRARRDLVGHETDARQRSSQSARTSGRIHLSFDKKPGAQCRGCGSGERPAGAGEHACAKQGLCAHLRAPFGRQQAAARQGRAPYQPSQRGGPRRGRRHDLAASRRLC
jgi:hypothetical protein